jgi:anti-anti-sigma regulatory factor
MAKTVKKTVALPAIVDLDSLDAIRDRLIDAVEIGPVAVSADAVERVSTNALFMLISAAETAKSNQNAFEIEKPSAAMIAAIDRLGLGARFTGMMKQ